MEQKFRTVNRILGSQPKVGPFAAHQLIPFAIIFVLSFISMQIFQLNWLDLIFINASLMFTYVIVFSKHSSQIICRMYKCPYIVRGGAIYNPLISV
ncbi:MAG: hypothetical protein EA365_14090 [Gloeocapsa sp. DLM2.Bin57]|nr:MAG: hypothetical protein EA365_14090 [Gloeocapsa sp. DLM2.Bin57]